MRKLLVALLGVVFMTQVYADVPAAKVLLKPNQQMVDITLAANATTGYQWFVQTYDHDLLSLQNYRYIPNPKKQGQVGVGGVAIFSFAVDPRFYDAPQTTLVSFVYQQPWNPGKNASVVKVAVSATASSNDLSNWQKYPQLAGPAAEVQAGEADIYAEDQGQAKPMSVPQPMVALPGNTQVSTATTTSTTAATATVVNSAPTPAASQSQWLSLPASSAPATISPAKTTTTTTVTSTNNSSN